MFLQHCRILFWRLAWALELNTAGSVMARELEFSTLYCEENQKFYEGVDE